MSDAEPPLSAAPASPANSYAAATQTIRATVRWLLTAAAGVAAILVAGLQLTNLGSLELDDPRLWIAIAGLSAALVGIGRIILITSRILTDDWITLAQLRLEQFQAQLDQTSSTAELIENIETYQHELYAHVATSIADLYKQLIDANKSTRRPAAEEPGAKRWGKPAAKARPSSQLREAAVAVVQYANYYSARNRLRSLPRRLLPAAIAVVAGVLVFAYAANPPKKESPAPTIQITVLPSTPASTSPTPVPQSPQPSSQR